MKTFLVLFIIAASLPADAQRVKENIRQKVVIVDEVSADNPKADSKNQAQEKRKEPKDKKDSRFALTIDFTAPQRHA